jgi:DNA polymerase-3 subunit epsilon
MSRDTAAKQVKDLGADIDTGVNKRTDFVIVGQGAGPSKLKKIEEFNSTGSSIKIINENQFIDLLKSGL